jgi:hypothetical protein
MLETLLLLLFCALIALLGLAIVLWLILTGRILTLDSLLLSLIGLTMSGIFGGLFAWSVRSGEFQAALNRQKSGPSDAPGSPSVPRA